MPGADADEGLESEELLDSQGCQVENVPWREDVVTDSDGIELVADAEVGTKSALHTIVVVLRPAIGRLRAGIYHILSETFIPVLWSGFKCTAAPSKLILDVLFCSLFMHVGHKNYPAFNVSTAAQSFRMHVFEDVKDNTNIARP